MKTKEVRECAMQIPKEISPEWGGTHRSGGQCRRSPLAAPFPSVRQDARSELREHEKERGEGGKQSREGVSGQDCRARRAYCL